jgi:hypothetical protein
MASYYAPRFITTEKAAVDLSSSQFLYVAENGSNLINITGGTNGAKGLGFLMNQPEAGEACEIASLGGGAKGIAAETITVSAGNVTELKADANGKMRNALPGDIVSALAIESAAVSDVFEVMPVYYVKGSALISILSAVDLTSGTGLYVGDNGSGKANVVGGINGAIGYGFLANAPDTDEAAIITGLGAETATAVAGETISAAQAELKSNASGKLVAALPGDMVVAISTEAAAADASFTVIPVLYQKDSAPVTFQAAADLTSKQYYYVGDSSGDVDVVGGATGAVGYGFLMNAPDTGEDAVINGPGYPFAKAISHDAIAINDKLISLATGKVDAGGTTGDIIVGIALSASAGADETIDVLPVLYIHP